MITATVVVCTRTRAGILEQCLASLENQILDHGRLEMLVVDNGSTDSTPALLRAWQRAPHRRAVVEPRIGVSNARNMALRSSDRDVVLFIDDDALVPAGWALAHLEAYGADDSVGAVGGPVGLHWPAGRPAWITDELTQWYSALELGDELVPLPTGHGPYGTYMSRRRPAGAASISSRT